MYILYIYTYIFIYIRICKTRQTNSNSSSNNRNNQTPNHSLLLAADTFSSGAVPATAGRGAAGSGPGRAAAMIPPRQQGALWRAFGCLSRVDDGGSDGKGASFTNSRGAAPPTASPNGKNRLYEEPRKQQAGTAQLGWQTKCSKNSEAHWMSD